MTGNDIADGVRTCVAQALELAPEGVRIEDRLVEDLGADSLDLLDLLFQLEQRFRVKISPRDIERRAAARLEGRPLVVDGVYTPEALMELRRSLPEVPPEELAPGLAAADLPRCFRVATMANLVAGLLEATHD